MRELMFRKQIIDTCCAFLQGTDPNASDEKQRNAWPRAMNSHKFISERGPG